VRVDGEGEGRKEGEKRIRKGERGREERSARAHRRTVCEIPPATPPQTSFSNVLGGRCCGSSPEIWSLRSSYDAKLKAT